MRFLLNGCDIWIVAEAPEDLTVKQLVTLSDRIRLNYCACGVRSLNETEQDDPTEVIFTYDNVTKADPEAPFRIIPKPGIGR